MHLGDDHALGAVHDERALVGHERDIAHEHVLFLDVLDRAGAGFLVHIKHDEAHLHFQRRGIGHVALDALFHIVFGRFELVGHEFEHGALGEILDREDRLEDRLQPLVETFARAHVLHQELLVGMLLHLDEVRHLQGFGDTTKTTCECASCR